MLIFDVIDVFFDLDFCDFNFWVMCWVQIVDEDGIGSDSEVKMQFVGVVIVDCLLENCCMQFGQVISGVIFIVMIE